MPRSGHSAGRSALPTGVPPVWAPAVLALPVLVGLLVGLSVRRVLPVPADRIRATVVAGVVAATGATLFALLAGGRLAAGPYDPVRFPPELVAPATLLWVGGVAAVVAILRRPSENPDYAEVVDPDEGRSVDDETEGDPDDEAPDSAAVHLEGEFDDCGSTDPVDDDPDAAWADDEVDRVAADHDDGPDHATGDPLGAPDSADSGSPHDDRDEPAGLDHADAPDRSPTPAPAPRRKVFGRRGARPTGPPPPKRPRTVADLVAERAAAERAAREADDR
jgi:hypothetical protein